MKTKTELTRPFEKLSKNDANLAGGKGASLGEMTQAGIPVPPGFVVLADAFEQFIRETDLIQEIDAILDKVDHKEIHTVEAASEKIRGLILNAQMPKDIADEIDQCFKKLDTKYVAVRSSATAEDGMDHAWAGQLESYLNTKEEDILAKVKLCWSSLFTPRAIFYRFEKGLHNTKISVAVVVQKMVESEVSGIAFSVHPVTEDRNQLIIEAGYGLGEAIVSGSVTPNSYVVEKEPRNILDINVSTQDRGLYRAEKPSAEHGNNEWITIPEPKASSQVLSGKQILEFAEIVLRIEKHYGFPCDIEWAYEKGKFYIVQSRPITTLTQNEQSKKDDDIILKDKSEYIALGQWVSPTLEFELWLDWSKTIDAKNFDLPQVDPVTVAVDGHYFTPKDGPYGKLTEDITKEFEIGSFDIASRIIELCKQKCSECVTMANNLKSKIEFEDFMKAVDLMSRIRFPWFGCFPIGDAGSEFIKKYALKNNISTDEVSEMIPKLDNSLNIDQNQLSKFKNQILKENLDFDIDLIEEKNLDLAKKIKEYQGKTEYIGTHHLWGEGRDIVRLMDAIKHASEESSSSNTLKNKIKELDIIAEATKWRLECAQSSAYLAYGLRKYMTKIAEQNSLAYHDLIFLTTSEIADLIKNKTEVMTVIKERQKKFGITKINGQIHIVLGKELLDWEKHFGLNETYDYINEIKGAIGNKGVVKGEVVVVLKPSDQSKVKPGMILVAPETTPDYIPSMGKAAAFITNQGGITSHAAIVAREMGKPCIIGTKIATRVLKDGDIVEVDANSGIVRLLK